MIKNSLKYTKYYYNLSERIKKGLIFLENTDLNKLSNGKYDIEDNEIYVNIQDYNTKPEKQGKWEAHREYIDIQYVIKGSEKIGVGEIQNFGTTEPYSKDRDVEFLTTSKHTDFVTLNENDFVILYPQDVHMPQISCSSKPDYVKKAVVKVKLQ